MDYLKEAMSSKLRGMFQIDESTNDIVNTYIKGSHKTTQILSQVIIMLSHRFTKKKNHTTSHVGHFYSIFFLLMHF